MGFPEHSYILYRLPYMTLVIFHHDLHDTAAASDPIPLFVDMAKPQNNSPAYSHLSTQDCRCSTSGYVAFTAVV